MRRIIEWSLVALIVTAAPCFAQRQQRPNLPRMAVVTPQSTLGSFAIPRTFGPLNRTTFNPTLATNGRFVLSSQGNFSSSNGAFTPSATGDATLIGQGVFAPTKGTFIPAIDGNFILTVRAALDPATGTFT